MVVTYDIYWKSETRKDEPFGFMINISDLRDLYLTGRIDVHSLRLNISFGSINHIRDGPNGVFCSEVMTITEISAPKDRNYRSIRCSPTIPSRKIK